MSTFTGTLVTALAALLAEAVVTVPDDNPGGHPKNASAFLGASPGSSLGTRDTRRIATTSNEHNAPLPALAMRNRFTPQF
jgi:hypothetical protein